MFGGDAAGQGQIAGELLLIARLAQFAQTRTYCAYPQNHQAILVGLIGHCRQILYCLALMLGADVYRD